MVSKRVIGAISTVGVAAIVGFNSQSNFSNYRVIDGDTVAVDIKEMPEKFKKNIKIRVLGVDTAESKRYLAGCDKEVEMGLKAKAYVKGLVTNANTLDVTMEKNDKYGSRYLGDIIIDGNSLRGLLINGGYARPYFGDKKKSWCD